MKTLLALLMIATAAPSMAAECTIYYAPSQSLYAGHWLRFLEDGRVMYNGNITQRLYVDRCSDLTSICMYHGNSVLIRTHEASGLRYFTFFDSGLPTETLPWHSRVEDCKPLPQA